MENKELSKCCNSEVKVVNGEEGTSWYMCVDCGESCDISPHQEPVATQKEEIEHDNHNPTYCTRCKLDASPTQEPMEWESEFDKLIDLHTEDCLCYYKDGKQLRIDEKCPHTIVKHFLKSQIKQAEERHNQDCTREEWARASVVREIIDHLESNPNEDGSTSPSIQHWIEKKQSQLRKLYQLSPTKKSAIINNK